VALLTDALLLAAFVLRVLGMTSLHTIADDEGFQWRLYSFQVLSCVAPLIWISESLLDA
jgi:hypothetical protein